jgi:hypothetical protein
MKGQACTHGWIVAVVAVNLLDPALAQDRSVMEREQTCTKSYCDSPARTPDCVCTNPHCGSPATPDCVCTKSYCNSPEQPGCVCTKSYCGPGSIDFPATTPGCVCTDVFGSSCTPSGGMDGCSCTMSPPAPCTPSVNGMMDGCNCDCTIPSSLPDASRVVDGTCTNADYVWMLKVTENPWNDPYLNARKAASADWSWFGSCYAEVLTHECALHNL